MRITQFATLPKAQCAFDLDGSARTGKFPEEPVKGPFGTGPSDSPDPISFDDLLGSESDLLSNLIICVVSMSATSVPRLGY